MEPNLVEELRHPTDGWTGDAACVSSEIAERAADEIERLRSALSFVADICGEELAFAKVGTGAEVALRHAHRKANESLK